MSAGGGAGARDWSMGNHQQHQQQDRPWPRAPLLCCCCCDARARPRWLDKGVSTGARVSPVKNARARAQRRGERVAQAARAKSSETTAFVHSKKIDDASVGRGSKRARRVMRAGSDIKSRFSSSVADGGGRSWGRGSELRRCARGAKWRRALDPRSSNVFAFEFPPPRSRLQTPPQTPQACPTAGP